MQLAGQSHSCRLPSGIRPTTLFYLRYGWPATWRLAEPADGYGLTAAGSAARNTGWRGRPVSDHFGGLSMETLKYMVEEASWALLLYVSIVTFSDSLTLISTVLTHFLH